ncbi:hypothetical protein [Aeromicrobium sp.]|uniref:hypothetical protein n=1 Tax=Aeromicrobium sp. TaxID=1871063 RepID=UPI0025B7D37F|nr:hypothetical protein [Aeromicrobium sp.]MCK5891063.1 hypothetical protein [Aeromicrobium sp.]
MIDLTPLHAVLGHWRTSGQVLDEHGPVVVEIAGTDTYTLLPGGTWIAHDVDVAMGEHHRALTHEVIGGEHAEGGWQMVAFETAPRPNTMRLTLEEPGLLLVHGVGVRSWLRTDHGTDQMCARWERQVEGEWLSWMDLTFDRLAPPER